MKRKENLLNHILQEASQIKLAALMRKLKPQPPNQCRYASFNDKKNKDISYRVNLRFVADSETKSNRHERSKKNKLRIASFAGRFGRSIASLRGES